MAAASFAPSKQNGRLNKLVVRVDADGTIGLGHAMRCLALAQQWKRMVGPVCFLMASPPEMLAKKMHTEGFTLNTLQASAGGPQDAEETLALFRATDANWLVVDGYHFTLDFAEMVSQVPTLGLDDLGTLAKFPFSIVLNFGVHANQHMYSRRMPHTQLLLGPGHFLLRDEFLKKTIEPRVFSANDHQLTITFGGADRENITLDVIRALRDRKTEKLKLNVLISSINKNRQLIRDFSTTYPMRLIEDAQDMATELVRSDLVITAMGTTVWELMYLGVPALGIPLHPTHRMVSSELAARNLICATEISMVSETVDKLLSTPLLRKQMSKNSREFIDGKGAERAVIAMVTMSKRT